MASKIHWKILSPEQKRLWDKVAGVKLLEQFYLAGGTALALHLGHRASIDFDFFSRRASLVIDLSTNLLHLE